MGRIFFLGLSICLALLSPCYALSGKVVEVREGDTLIVATEGRLVKIYLYGVASPLKGQPFNQDARLLARFLSLNKPVEIVPVFHGGGGFMRALVRVDGTKYFLNERLVGYGMAWVRPAECRATLCEEWRKMEFRAREKSIGLWADPAAVAPWDYEAEQKRQILRRRATVGKEQN